MSENLTIDEILRQAEEIRKKTARKAEAAIDKIDPRYPNAAGAAAERTDGYGGTRCRR